MGCKVNRLPNKWVCISAQFDEMCMPRNWTIVDQSKILFLCKVDSFDNNCFMAVLRYDTLTSEIKNVSKYLDEVKSLLISDTLEGLDQYSIRYVKFANKEVYHCEFTTIIGEHRLVSLCMYVQYKGFVYDFTLKIPEKDRDYFNNIFQEFLLNYKSNGEYLFTTDEEVLYFENLLW